jgi:hypothetical protein
VFATLHRLYCAILEKLGFKTRVTYNKENDPLFHKYADLDCRADELRKYWKPRDLIDVR